MRLLPTTKARSADPASALVTKNFMYPTFRTNLSPGAGEPGLVRLRPAAGFVRECFCPGSRTETAEPNGVHFGSEDFTAANRTSGGRTTLGQRPAPFVICPAAVVRTRAALAAGRIGNEAAVADLLPLLRA